MTSAAAICKMLMERVREREKIRGMGKQLENSLVAQWGWGVGGDVVHYVFGWRI